MRDGYRPPKNKLLSDMTVGIIIVIMLLSLVVSYLPVYSQMTNCCNGSSNTASADIGSSLNNMSTSKNLGSYSLLNKSVNGESYESYVTASDATEAGPRSMRIIWNKTIGDITGDLPSGDKVIDLFKETLYLTAATENYEKGMGSSDISLIEIDSDSGIVLKTSTWGGAGSDFPYGIATDSEGSAYITGYTTSSGSGGKDIVLLRFSDDGHLVWNLSWGGSNDDYGQAIEDNIFVVGSTYTDDNSWDAVLLKYNKYGNFYWAKSWGGSSYDYAKSVVVDKYGNIYVTGYTSSYGNHYQVFLLKYASNGTLEWYRIWGGTDDDYGYSVVVDETGNNIYVTGSTYYDNSYQLFLLKYNSSGYFEWSRIWGGSGYESGLSVAVSKYDIIYVTGYTDSYGNGDRDSIILAYSNDGVFMWSEYYGDVRSDRGQSVITSSDKIYVLGQTTTDYGDRLFLLKYDSCSTSFYKWSTQWGVLNQREYATDVINDNESIYIVGYTNNTESGDYDSLLVKADLQGHFIFSKQWGGTDDDYGQSVAVDDSGNVYITGYTRGITNFENGWQVFLIKYSSSGNLQWYRTWGSTGDDYGKFVVVDSEGNIYVTGYTNSYGNGWQAFLLKFDNNGNLLWNVTWGGTNNDYGYSVAVDVNGSVYVTGGTYSYGNRANVSTQVR